jgi:hypothetical protein
MSAGHIFRRHWFYVLLPVWFAAAFAFSAAHPWAAEPRLGEAITLFDWCVFVPLLFAVCYRDMPGRALLVRTVATFCGGVWIAGKVVPDNAQFVLQDWADIRWVGLAVVMLFEIAAIVTILRILFGTAPNASELERQGLPAIVVKLTLAEARFWKWVWQRLNGK